MIQPLTLDEFEILAKDSRLIAVFQEIPADGLTPVVIYSLLGKTQQTPGVLLEDLHQREGLRYSFICFESMAALTISHSDERHPLTALRELQSRLAYSTRAEVAELIVSAIGFMTYDAVRYFEELPDRHHVDSSCPALLFNFYAISLTFDHEKQTILISVLAEINGQPMHAYTQAQQKILSIIKLLSTSSQTDNFTVKQKVTPTVEVEPSDVDFMHMVEKAKNYITRGDAFQIVLSRCFKRQYAVSPLDIYKILRRINPAPFMFYFPTESGAIIGASPERLIRVHNKQVTINPIAGTRPGNKEKTDEMIAADLLNDKKEVAEHMMLVDLARNDVGAVCCPGSVSVTELLQVKHYSHISHITSTVTGTCEEKYDALDALSLSFPAGTLSGAPKIRAMQIIDELETSRRGLYGGAIVRLDSLGNLDSCIAIRMAILQDGIATIRAGAGIVYDSNPADEAQETYQKAKSMLDAIAIAHGE